jgi:hypothetical protein
VRRIAEEREIQFLFGFETSQGFFWICARAKNHHV